MRCVTTCHRAGWDQYGLKAHDGLKHWPSDAEIIWYTEGFDLSQDLRVVGRHVERIERLAEFKKKHAYYLPPDWRYNVVRFANKVYAAHDALYDYDGIGVWMDADVIATQDIPPGYIESLLPNECYIAYFQREGWHCETGLWVVDCTHPEHKRFMDHLRNWYESGSFKDAHEWHDCIYMDATVRAFEREGLIRSHNLSGPHSKAEHPMAKHPLARYLDHLKGPARKDLGYSPERIAA